MMMPVTYRVRCNCVLEPAYRRYAVAPFDGLVASGFAEPGDVVQTGDVLAEIDGRNIRWELSGVTAERLSSLRQREIELVDENIPELFLAELDNEKHLAEEAILNIKKDGLQIRSPIDGVVLSGSLERSEASSVKTGDVLFEVGSTEEMKIQIEIPADEVSQIGVGQAAKIWVEGNEDFPLETEISRIHPRSVIRDAKNVFIAEVKFENKDTRFRPGMKGVVRIDGYQRSLGWSLFHKPIDYIRSHFTWW
jgi:biotin carboxyl carrier protein